MRRPQLFVTFWLALILCTVRGTTAAESDAALDVPSVPARVTDQESLRALIVEYRAAFERANRETVPGAFIRDPALYHKQHDILWSIRQALDDNRAIDPTEFGFTKTERGGYSIRVQDFPEWNSFGAFLRHLRSPELSAMNEEALKERGFRDRHLESIRSYLLTNDPRRVSFFQNRLLTDHFARTIAERRKSGIAIGRAEVQAYTYRAQRNIDEAERQVGSGLLASLDGLRQRILISYYRESNALIFTSRSSDDPDAEARKALDYLASGKYIEDLDRQEAALLKELR